MLVFSHIASICSSFMRGITMQPFRRPHWRRCAVSGLLEKTLRPFVVGRHVRDQAIQAQNVARAVRQQADRFRHVPLAPGRMPQQAADLRLPLIWSLSRKAIAHSSEVPSARRRRTLARMPEASASRIARKASRRLCSVGRTMGLRPLAGRSA
nr:hypothetical protein [Massilia violaceinigra]